MKEVFLTIGCNSLDESREFYQNLLGFTLEREFAPGPDIRIAFLKRPDLKIELVERGDMMLPGNDQSSLTITVTVDDLAPVEQKLQTTGCALPERATLPNGMELIRFQDPDGVNVTVIKDI